MAAQGRASVRPPRSGREWALLAAQRRNRPLADRCGFKSGFVEGAARHPCRALRVGCAARTAGLQATIRRGFGKQSVSRDAMIGLACCRHYARDDASRTREALTE